MNTIRYLVTGLVIGASCAWAADEKIEQNEPPVINHFPTLIAYRGQPVPVYARVSDKTGKVKEVSLFYALSQQKAPLKVPMKLVQGNRYSGLIPANFFGESSKVWYFVEARDSFDDKAETTWCPVTIKDPNRERTQGEEEVAQTSAQATKTTGTQGAAGKTSPGTAGTAGSAGPAGTTFPAGAIPTTAASGGGIGAGTVVGGVLVAGAVGGGIAIASGGGGGGDDDDGGGGSGFDPSSTVIVNANGNASGGFSSGPQDRTIDGSSQVGGRTITGVRVTLNYEAFSIADQFQIIYQGDVIADSGVVSGSGSIQGTAGGSSASVVIRVLTPSSSTAWEWSARVEYSVAE